MLPSSLYLVSKILLSKNLLKISQFSKSLLFVLSVAALPFLIANPVAYLIGAFDVGRVFMYKWTVNWRFLPEEIFVNRGFHIMLLGMHIFLIALFLPEWITYLKSFASLRQLEKDLFSKQKEKLAKKKNNQSDKVCDHFLSSFLFV